MNVYKCDRCKKLFKKRGEPDISIRRYIHGYGDFKINLCKDCYSEFIEWCNFKNKEQLIEEARICYENPNEEEDIS